MVAVDTVGRVLAPVPTLLGTPNRGNHGGIAPTQIGEPTPGKWTFSNCLRSEPDQRGAFHLGTIDFG